MRLKLLLTEIGNATLYNFRGAQEAALEHVYQLPLNTFGGAYAQFMRKRHFHADDR